MWSGENKISRRSYESVSVASSTKSNIKRAIVARRRNDPIFYGFESMETQATKTSRQKTTAFKQHKNSPQSLNLSYLKILQHYLANETVLAEDLLNKRDGLILITVTTRFSWQ